MRLDGTQGKKQFWLVQNWGLSEANLLHWRKYLWHSWDVLSPTAAVRHPHNDFAPSELHPYHYAPVFISSSVVPHIALTPYQLIKQMNGAFEKNSCCQFLQ